MRGQYMYHMLYTLRKRGGEGGRGGSYPIYLHANCAQFFIKILSQYTMYMYTYIFLSVNISSTIQ